MRHRLEAVVPWARGHLHAARLSWQGPLSDRWPPLTHWWIRRDLAWMAQRHGAEVDRRARLPALLATHATSTWSQNGEDGMLEELFRRLDLERGVFAEIGAADGSENCTRALVERGWSGAWIEADPVAAGAAAGLELEGVVVVNTMVTPQNVEGVLDAALGDRALDLLVVDIDSQDWRVLRAALRRRRPTAIVAEYNAAFPPGRSWVLSPWRTGWDKTFRHGASLDALATMTASFGYELVGCDPAGVNAFFVRRGLLAGGHESPRTQARRLYTAPWFTSQPLGHPRTPSATRAMVALPLDALARIRLRDARPEGGRGPWSPGAPFGFSVVVANGSSVRLTSGRTAPFHLSARWLGGAATASDPAARRLPLPFAVPAGSSRRLFAWLAAPEVPGRYRLRVTAVQEGVAWLEPLHDEGWVELVVDVVA